MDRKAETGTGDADEPAIAPTVVRPVTNAVRILRYLNAAGAPQSLTAIARALEINTSTCFNILRTLAAEGVVAFDDRAKTYAIGLGIVQLANRALSETGRLEIVRPRLQDLADAHGVTVTLWRYGEGDRNVLISASQSTGAFQIRMAEGQRLPLFIGAFGRVLAGLSGLDEPRLRAEFARMRWAEPPAFEDWHADIAAARACGWAVDDGNFAAGVTSVAAAVPGPDPGRGHGVVASMFRGQLTAAQTAALADDLLAVCADLSGLF